MRHTNKLNGKNIYKKGLENKGARRAHQTKNG